jgi:hypothetical protein
MGPILFEDLLFASGGLAEGDFFALVLFVGFAWTLVRGAAFSGRLGDFFFRAGIRSVHVQV